MEREALLQEQATLTKRLKEIKRQLRSVPDRPKNRCLYVLACKGGRYYIGQTTNLKKRYEKHQRGSACWFTKAHYPNRIVQVIELGLITQADAAVKECDLAYTYIERFGHEKVRGGGFIQRDPKHFKRLLHLYSTRALDDEMYSAISRDES